MLERGEEGRDVLETFWSAKLACNERIVDGLVLIEVDSMAAQENEEAGWWWEKDNIGLDALSVLLLSKTPNLSDKIKSYPHLITSATFSRVWTLSCRRNTHPEYEMKVPLHDLDHKEGVPTLYRSSSTSTGPQSIQTRHPALTVGTGTFSNSKRKLK